MISVHPARRWPVAPIVSLLGSTIAAELALTYGTESFPSNLLCDLALIAVFVAAIERRHKAMLAAAGLACGLALYGAMLLPLAIGLASSRRAARRALLLVPLLACFAIIALGRPWLPSSLIGMWSVARQPDLTGLMAAFALGSLAWLTATLSARPLMHDMVPTAALSCALGCALVLPGASMAVPLALACRCKDRRVSLLTILAALLAAFAVPIPATLALMVALTLAARSLRTPAANDNRVFARELRFVTLA
jgi:hypothetical protein